MTILQLRFSRRRALALFAGAALSLASLSAQTRQPKLVLGLVIDQFRYDYLTRYRSEYTSGLKRLMDEGANFTNANYRHYPTLTAVGHSTFLSGATPSVSGIIGNEWFDRERKELVTSVSDPRVRLVGANGGGSSPRKLLPSTIGDELKSAGKGGKIIGISIKDRSAILPSGHSADAAYWMDSPSGKFVTSTFYMNALPGWLDDVNKGKPADKYAGQLWLDHKMPEAGRSLYDELPYTPYGNELIQLAALRALGAERLGTGAKTDLLTVSYSSNDYVGHRYGPDSPEAKDAAIRVDRLVGELIQAAETQAGAGNVLVVLTADHGVAPLPEQALKDRKIVAGRLDEQSIGTTLDLVLSAKFGGSHWISDISSVGIYLDLATVGGQKVDLSEVEEVAASTLRSLPHIARAYTRTQLLRGEIPSDPIGNAFRNGYYGPRSGNVLYLQDPYWIASATGTTHGTPYAYDTHVPLLFWGPQIKAGRYNAEAAPNDIAPTLATILDIETPSGSSGRVLTEMLK